MSQHTAEIGARVIHPLHGEGAIRTVSPSGNCVTVHYPAGYVRTHRIADLACVTPPGEGLPDCEGWTCQSCGADNFIPPGFARVIPPELGSDVSAAELDAS